MIGVDLASRAGHDGAGAALDVRVSSGERIEPGPAADREDTGDVTKAPEPAETGRAAGDETGGTAHDTIHEGPTSADDGGSHGDAD
ncbi:hypothetical protein [Prosthecomicrobium sp. N25]|uniref:hypothetical protein n=1 Tax=Prosthecomicrobium sp. N25 TaxID=3129254 RepID=UPI0030783D13